MGRGPAIGVDDDLASGEAGVAVRAADDEPAGRVHVELGLRAHPALGQGGQDMGADDLADLVLASASTCWVETTTDVRPPAGRPRRAA